MKVLMFHAATSAVAIAAMTNVARGLRGQGHTVGERFLPAFKMEKEPADKVMILLSPSQASRYQNYGAELAVTYGFFGEDNGVPVLVELPETDEELLKDFDVDAAVSKLEGEKPGVLGLAQAKAEAIERGLEVTADTTREQLEHMLGVDISPGPQADDRVTDERNNQNLGEQRIGLRTSNILPSVNGLDLVRMNDEQLRAAATQLGLKVTANMKRDTIIGAIQKTFAKKVDAPEDSGAKTGTGDAMTGDDGKGTGTGDKVDVSTLRTHADIDKVAADEGVELKDGMTVDQKRDAIEAARKEAANG